MYQTTWFGHFWNGKRWAKRPKPPFSSHRDHRNAKTAWREFNRIRHPDFILIHWKIVGGKRQWREWHWKLEGAADFGAKNGKPVRLEERKSGETHVLRLEEKTWCQKWEQAASWKVEKGKRR